LESSFASFCMVKSTDSLKSLLISHDVNSNNITTDTE